MDFNNLHSIMEEFVNVNTKIQTKRFAIWAFAAYKSYIGKTTFKIEPDNKELQQFCNERHSKCIIPSINQARTTQSNLSNHASILKQLERGLNQMGEANEAANNYAKSQIELKESEMESKKDRVTPPCINKTHAKNGIHNRARQSRRPVQGLQIIFQQQKSRISGHSTLSVSSCPRVPSYMIGRDSGEE